MKRVADQIADWLVQQGVSQVFGVTGGGAMFLNQALGGHKQLDCIYMHHEQACAMAAEGYARISGKPAVVMLTTGPGAINAFNGVFGAYTDSIPMLVLSGQVKRETCLSFQDLPALRQLGDQEGPTVAMAASICKEAVLIRDAQDLETALPRAYWQTLAGRPGPVWIDIPLDIQSATDVLKFSTDRPPNTTPIPDLKAHCADVVRALQTAHRPLVLAGTGVRLAGAERTVCEFIERHGIPMATAWTHDLIASDHPLFAGRPGTIGTRAGNFCQQNADVVLVLGSRLNIRQTSYNWAAFGKNAQVIQVDIDPAELAKPGAALSLRIDADIQHFLTALNAALREHPLPDYSSWRAWCATIGSEHDVRREHAQRPGAPLNPYLVVDRIFSQLRNDDVIACGNASACILPFQIGRLTADQRMFSNSGSASMGYELPAAIGAAAAARGDKAGHRVICFAGDGSLQMNIQELQTLKTLKGKVIILVLNNGGYLSIRQTHENFFGRVIGATPTTGVEFPDFAAIAAAYGIKSAHVRNEADLAMLDQYLHEDGPMLIDITVDPEQEFSPRIKSRVAENGQFVTPELDDMYPFLDPKVIATVRESARQVQSRPQHDG